MPECSLSDYKHLKGVLKVEGVYLAADVDQILSALTQGEAHVPRRDPLQPRPENLQDLLLEAG